MVSATLAPFGLQLTSSTLRLCVMQPSRLSFLWIALWSVQVYGQQPVPAVNPQTPVPNQTRQAAIDMRPIFDKFGLVPRQQGERPTCSVFTVANAIEFAIAKRQSHTPRLSVDFLNWAANRACADTNDGGFFSDLWKGFNTYGLTTEKEMPYGQRFDPNREPSLEALFDAKARLSLGLRLHWIKEWNVNTGLEAEQLSAIKMTFPEVPLGRARLANPANRNRRICEPADGGGAECLQPRSLRRYR